MCSNSIKKIIFVIRFLLALGLVHLVQGSSASEFKSLFFAGRQRSLNCAFVSIETVAQRCSVKKVFLEILQNSLEKTCARVSFFNKVAATLLKKRLWHRCFPVNLAKLLRTPFFTEHLRWLLLKVCGRKIKKSEMVEPLLTRFLRSLVNKSNHQELAS